MAVGTLNLTGGRFLKKLFNLFIALAKLTPEGLHQDALLRRILGVFFFQNIDGLTLR